MSELRCLVVFLLLLVPMSRAALTSPTAADDSLASLRRTSLELQPAEVSIRPIRELRAVPKACPNEVARPVFRWPVVARKWQVREYTNCLTSPLARTDNAG